MSIAANVVIAVIALLHLWFLILEMFLWTKPSGLRAFGTTAEFAEQSKALAANQGLYNGFLAAGLVWGLVEGGHVGFHIEIFFLACVIVAGIYGAATVNKRIFFFQALPALLALVALHL